MKDVFRAYLKNYDDKLIKNNDPGLKRMFFAEPVYTATSFCCRSS